MSQQKQKSEGPFLKVIETALLVWIKSQCKAIEKIDLKLHGSFLNILQGKLSKVELIARDINFKSLPFHKVELESGPIDVNIGVTLKSKKIAFNQFFIINGIISISEKGLNTILNSKDWNWISKWISQELLNGEKVERLSVIGEYLQIQSSYEQQSSSKKNIFSISASSGSILFSDMGANREALLPMDSLVSIESVEILDKIFFITGSSKVNT